MIRFSPLLSKILQELQTKIEETETAFNKWKQGINKEIQRCEESQQRLIIKLNVGGDKFTTTLTTLTQQSDSMLAAMFSGRLVAVFFRPYIFLWIINRKWKTENQ